MKRLPQPGAIRRWLRRAWSKRDDWLGIGYCGWLQRHFPQDAETTRRMTERAQQLESGPSIAIAMAVFNPPIEYLHRAIESVRMQTYPRWQLCICDDASSDPATAALLERAQATDARIRVITRSANGHICQATNDAIALAHSEWIGFLDHDDELMPYALGLVAAALVGRPEAQLLYTDEDKLDARGLRCRPHFKPGWNPALLLGQNYLCHLTVYRLDRVLELGGLRPGYEGAQDHDLALRYTEGLKAHQVIHLPHILYHWRMHSQSTAMRIGAKPYAQEAAERAVSDALRRRGMKARVEPAGLWWRVRPELPSPAPAVSVIVNSAKAGAQLSRCIGSVLAVTPQTELDFLVTLESAAELSAARRRTLDTLCERFACKALLPRLGDTPTTLRRRAIEQSKAPYVLLLDESIEAVCPHWLHALLGWAVQADVAAVGAALWSPRGRLVHGGLHLGVRSSVGNAHDGLWRGEPGEHGRALLPQDFMACSGTCLMVKRTAYLAVGGLDAEGFPDALADVDLCLRLRSAGWRVIWSPAAELVLHRQATQGMRLPKDVRKDHKAWSLIRSRRGEPSLSDPLLHPDECRHDEAFRRASSPRASWSRFESASHDDPADPVPAKTPEPH